MEKNAFNPTLKKQNLFAELVLMRRCSIDEAKNIDNLKFLLHFHISFYPHSCRHPIKYSYLLILLEATEAKNLDTQVNTMNSFCLFSASPGIPFHHVNNYLFLQGETLFHDVSSGIIISNQSLVVQRVTRSDSGQYTCHVFNSEGEGVSNAVSLTVKCKQVHYNL